MTFRELFEEALDAAPYPYQTRLASDPSLPDAINVPTGAGKTAAAVLSWLWRRRFHPDADVRNATPRRLVYCLPMRVLVEQTADRTRTFLDRLDLLNAGDPVQDDGVSVHVLMGGELASDWVLAPDQDAVLVGTQDMLLSRALNRGYAASRFRWPMEFGFLHTDAFWVFDEPQLMGPGRATSSQLEALRRRLGTWQPTGSLWMSATLHPEDLATVDFDGSLDVARLSDEDTERPRLRERMEASKSLRSAGLEVPTRKTELRRSYIPSLAESVLDAHQDGTQTLVVLNTVDRAQRLQDELLDRGAVPVRPTAENDESPENAPRLLLAHSRFRGWEREPLNRKLEGEDFVDGGRIVVATQVVEAGVDLSSRTLFTELAPWSSLVQRFGRCNRYGEHAAADLFWIDVPSKEAAPYEPTRVEDARERAREHTGGSAAPARLEVAPQPPARPVLRRRDLLDFFDTEADLSGNETDPSRFIRETEDRDASVFWRELDGAEPGQEMDEPERRELCGVPLRDLRDWFDDDRPAWCWDPLDARWRRARRRDLRPGRVLLLSSDSGGYDSVRGWSPGTEEPVAPVPRSGPGSESEGMGDDLHSQTTPWIRLADHTERVVGELDALLAELGSVDLDARSEQAVRVAARWHDLGKAHGVFQSALGSDDEKPEAGQAIWAKAPEMHRYERPYFRHELASALALIEYPALLEGEPVDDDLVAYLVAAHHGKVRLGIRTLPEEEPPPTDGNEDPPRYARGIWAGDELPPVDLGGGYRSPSVTLSLDPVEIGRGDGGEASWLDRMLALRDRQDLGPFRLAYLEALLRAADWRASRREQRKGADV